MTEWIWLVIGVVWGLWVNLSDAKYYKRIMKLQTRYIDLLHKKLEGEVKDGKYVPEITWTNCADAMPPDDATQLLVRSASTGRLMYKVSGCNLRTYFNIKQYDWTPYTPEKWDHLNNEY